MKMNQVFQGKYLKSDSDEIPEDGDTVVTIRVVVMETLRGDNGDEEKPVMYFNEYEKGMVVNKTNWGIISKALGSDESEDWPGRQIALYSADVQFGSEMKRGIRVRSKAPKRQAAQQAAPVAAARPAQQQAAPPRRMTQADVDNPAPDDDIPFASPFVDDANLFNSGGDPIA